MVQEGIGRGSGRAQGGEVRRRGFEFSSADDVVILNMEVVQ